MVLRRIKLSYIQVGGRVEKIIWFGVKQQYTICNKAIGFVQRKYRPSLWRDQTAKEIFVLDL